SLYRLAGNKADLDDARTQLKALSSSENISIVFPALPSDLESGVLTRAAPGGSGEAAGSGAATQPAAGEGGGVWLKMLHRATGALKAGAGGGPPPARGGPPPPPPPKNQ